MKSEHTIIIGAGPCGLACALALKNKGINPLIIEKENIVNTIFQFPTHQTFFSTSEKLEIGNVPFISARDKPVRKEALAYYREVVRRNDLRIQSFEKVYDVIQTTNHFKVKTKMKTDERKSYIAQHVIIATGYYDQPNYIDVQGEQLSKVSHYFQEAHPYYNQDVVIIGGKNSAVDAAIELHKANANVTVLYRGDTYSSSIKPWILPQFQPLINHEKIKMEFNATVLEITNNTVKYKVAEKEKTIQNDFVFAMTGYHPNITLLDKIGIEMNSTDGKPHINPHTFETNIKNVYVAGVVISGFNANETFIENGRHHGSHIANHIVNKDRKN